jgi:Holliday junction resolvasome RuvABC endonuclease subunit
VPKARKGSRDRRSVTVEGWDLALNHAGFVRLVDGHLKDFVYATDKAGAADQSAVHGRRLPKWKMEDKQEESMLRLRWWEQFLRRHLERTKPDYVGIEDYALEGGAHGAHYKGELGGVARLAALAAGAKMRLHDPGSVKLYAAHNGKAEKDEVEEAVYKRWGIEFGHFNPKPKPGKKQNRQTSEDLADAFAVARLVWMEVQLRAGRALLSQLHPKEVQVFNRVTKAYPVSLLGREWIEGAAA